MRKVTIGILAHVDSGKTTFIESLLYETGVIPSLGRVDHKNSFLDNDSAERERGITIYSKNARIKLPDRDLEMILIDTPGHVDFGPEMERSLQVLDVAILVISGSAGIEAHTKTLWSMLKSLRIPTFIFVNKMDMPGTDKSGIMDLVKNSLSAECVDFMGQDTSFYEDVATADEAFLEEFFETEAVADEHICVAIRERKVFPVLFGSALKQEGIKEFLDIFTRFLPIGVTASEAGDFAGVVYKISTDKSGKRLTFIKILSGEIKVKSLLQDEKINEIRLYSGEKYECVQEAGAGDICALVSLKNTKVGQVFGNSSKKFITNMSPALSYSVRFPKDKDINLVYSDFLMMCDEDPSLNVTYNEETREIIVYLMGEVQAEILKKSIGDRFGYDVDFTDGRILYKETIDASFEGVGHFEPLRHYAEAHILLSPNECGTGMSYEADIPEERLARNWQRLIYTHMTEKNHRGVLIGAPITDIHLKLVSGRAHQKHTEGGDFRQATYRAIRQGLMQLRESGHCHLLEPYYDYTLELPTEHVGRAMTDITAMNGTSAITESDLNEGISVLCGKVPVSTVNGYSKEVLAYTKGLGKLYLTLSGYERCHNEEEIINASSYDPDADLRNPAASVFCSHGAGTVIPWNEVPEYMHIEYQKDVANSGSVPFDANLGSVPNGSGRKAQDIKSTLDVSLGVEEIDRILLSNSYANAKGRQGGYKGISAALNQKRQDNSGSVPNASKSGSVPVYKGTKKKEKYILVDGYNVINSWDDLKSQLVLSIDAAAAKLNDILCNYQAMTGENITVVYDAYKVKGGHISKTAYNNIEVVYTAEDQTADRYIERFCHDNKNRYDFTVVTSDAVEQIVTSGAGAVIISSREFELNVRNKTSEFNEKFGVK